MGWEPGAVIFAGKDLFVRPPLRRVEVSSANPGNLRWPAGGGAAGLVKAQRVQVERAGEGVQETDGIFGTDVVVERFGEEQSLATVQSSAVIQA